MQHSSGANSIKGRLSTRGRLPYSATSRCDFQIQMKTHDSFIRDVMTLRRCENSLQWIPGERLLELAWSAKG